MTNTETTLYNGVKIPRIGLGTYPLRGKLLTSTIQNAYDLGYRLIDTADNYYNEADLGESLKLLYSSSDAIRETIFLVSKVSDELYEPGTIGGGMNKGKYFWKSSPIMQQPHAIHNVVKKKIEDTLRNLCTDYLDLYLVHWPYPDYFQEIWYEMEQLYKSGLVRSIGTCNCAIRHLEKLREACEILPMVNQIETSPINTKSKIINYCNLNNIKTIVYSPLMSLRRKEQKDYQLFLENLSLKHDRSKAQIVLRYDIQRGLIPIPKSSNLNRLSDNFSVFDFELTEQEMNKLSEYNVDYQYLPESKSCPGL